MKSERLVVRSKSNYQTDIMARSQNQGERRLQPTNSFNSTPCNKTQTKTDKATVWSRSLIVFKCFIKYLKQCKL